MQKAIIGGIIGVLAIGLLIATSGMKELESQRDEARLERDQARKQTDEALKAAWDAQRNFQELTDNYNRLLRQNIVDCCPPRPADWRTKGVIRDPLIPRAKSDE